MYAAATVFPRCSQSAGRLLAFASLLALLVVQPLGGLGFLFHGHNGDDHAHILALNEAGACRAGDWDWHAADHAEDQICQSNRESRGLFLADRDSLAEATVTLIVCLDEALVGQLTRVGVPATPAAQVGGPQWAQPSRDELGTPSPLVSRMTDAFGPARSGAHAVLMRNHALLL